MRKFVILAIALSALAGGATTQASDQADPIASIDVNRWQEYSPPIRFKKPPIYPAHEQRRRIGGTAYVLYTYDQDGTILTTNIARTSGSAPLDRAALNAVAEWKVTPKSVDGRGVAGYGVVPINFTP